MDILFLACWNFYTKNVILGSQKGRTRTLVIHFSCRNLDKLSIKCQSFLKSTKMSAFEQKISTCHSHGHIRVQNTLVQLEFRVKTNFEDSLQILICLSHKHLPFYTERKKWSHFDLKNWVTGGTKIRPGNPSNWRIFETNWLDIASQFNWLNFLGQNDSIFSFSVTGMQ